MLSTVAHFFERKMTTPEYVGSNLSCPVLTELGSATRDITAAWAGPVRYVLDSLLAVLSFISHASQPDLKSCKKVVDGMRSFSEKALSFTPITAFPPCGGGLVQRCHHPCRLFNKALHTVANCLSQYIIRLLENFEHGDLARFIGESQSSGFFVCVAILIFCSSLWAFVFIRVGTRICPSIGSVIRDVRGRKLT